MRGEEKGRGAEVRRKRGTEEIWNEGMRKSLFYRIPNNRNGKESCVFFFLGFIFFIFGFWGEKDGCAPH